jgi:mannitol-specific phosphotransferase system IIBC component
VPTISGSDIKKLVVACDAGMGSSVMLAGQLRKQLKQYPVEVTHTPVHEIPDDADLIVTHRQLVDRVRAAAPGKPVVAFMVFLGDPAVAKVVAAVKDGTSLDV